MNYIVESTSSSRFVFRRTERQHETLRNVGDRWMTGDEAQGIMGRKYPFSPSLLPFRANEAVAEGEMQARSTIKPRFTAIRLMTDSLLLRTVCFVSGERKPQLRSLWTDPVFGALSSQFFHPFPKWIACSRATRYVTFSLNSTRLIQAPR